MAALVVGALTIAAVVALLLLDPGSTDSDNLAGDRTTVAPPGSDTGTGEDIGSGEETGESPSGGEPDPTDDTPTEPEDSSGPGGGGNDGPRNSPAAVVAPGLEVYAEDPSYTIGVPADWTVSVESSTRTFFEDPESGRYLMVEEGGPPNGDPVEDWTAQEAYVSKQTTFPNYELIGIARVDYRDFETADWQFRFSGDNGSVRVRNRAAVDQELNRAYALYWVAPESMWEESEPLFEDIAASFQPLG